MKKEDKYYMRTIFYTFVFLTLTLKSISQQTVIVVDAETEDTTVVTKIYDTIRIKALEIDFIDVRFNIIIDNHIKEIHKKLMFNKKKYFCVIRIDNDADVYYTNIFRNYIPNIDDVIDSTYNNYQNFKNYNFDNSYIVTIRTMHRQSRSVNWVNYHKKFFYYNYRGWDILFVSNINIDFPNLGKYKELNFIIKNYFSDKDILKGNDCVDYMEYGSSYRLSNHYVYKRLKDEILFNE